PSENVEDAFPGTDMALAGGPPDPAVAPELGIDPVLPRERLDLVRRGAEGVAEAKRAGGPAEGLERGEFRPLRQHHAGIPAACTASADVGLDDGDIGRRHLPLDLDGGPEAGEPPADDADIRCRLSFETRGVHLVAGDRFTQPGA